MLSECAATLELAWASAQGARTEQNRTLSTKPHHVPLKVRHSRDPTSPHTAQAASVAKIAPLPPNAPRPGPCVAPHPARGVGRDQTCAMDSSRHGGDCSHSNPSNSVILAKHEMISIFDPHGMEYY